MRVTPAHSRARRLEGFTEPWTVAVHKGREMAADLTLAACGLAPAAEVVVVRRVLVPESAHAAACAQQLWQQSPGAPD